MADTGYIRDKIDLKFLILYVLSYLDIPVTYDEVLDMALVDGAVSCFDVFESFYELVESGHVTETEKKYMISEKGRAILPGFELRLPVTVCRNAQRAVLRTIAKIKRSAMITAETSENEENGQLITTLGMRDDFGEIIKLDMLVVNKRQAQMLESNFKAHAEAIYNDILAVLMKDYSEQND